jgi:hypothetical protein
LKVYTVSSRDASQYRDPADVGTEPTGHRRRARRQLTAGRGQKGCRRAAATAAIFPASAATLRGPRKTGHQREGSLVTEMIEWSLQERSAQMATYRMVYGDDESVVQETLTDIDEVEREDGWVVLFRGKDAILRVQEAHVQSMERLDA